LKSKEIVYPLFLFCDVAQNAVATIGILHGFGYATRGVSAKMEIPYPHITIHRK
jgi:hypothetical protein